MSSNPPPAWYPDPAQQPPRQQSRPPGQRWNTPETWVAIVTILLLVPVTERASRAAVDAGAPQWLIVAAAAVVAVSAAFFLESGTGKARAGVLFGLYVTFGLTAISATATALDVWEAWIMVAVVVPILTVQWLRGRHRARTSRRREDSTV